MTFSVVGPVETVFSYERDRCDWRSIPDSPARALRRSDGSIALIAAHFRNRFLTGRDFDSLTSACSVPSGGVENADPAAFDDRFWIQALAPLPDGRILGLASHEYMGSRHPGACKVPGGRGASACWYSAIVATVATGEELRFTLQPRPVRLVAPPARPYDPNGGTAGFLTTTNIVMRDGYGSVLAWSEDGGAGGRRGHCLLRAPDADLLGGWQILSEGRFKPVGDPYGPVPPPACDIIGAGRLVGKVRSLIRIEERGLWLAIFATRRPGRPGEPAFGVYTSLSPDLVTWTEGQYLGAWEPFWGAGRCGTFYEYPSLIDHGSRSPVFDTGGGDLFLYMTRFNWEDCGRTRMNRDLVRVRLRIDGP